MAIPPCGFLALIVVSTWQNCFLFSVSKIVGGFLLEKKYFVTSLALSIYRGELIKKYTKFVEKKEEKVN